MNRAEQRITLYGTRHCAHCRNAKEFLLQHGIRFREYDVEQNQRALKELQRQGARRVPLILVGDKQLVGFNEQQMIRILRKSGYHV